MGFGRPPGSWHTRGMAQKRTPRPRDPIQLGKLMIDIATGAVPDAVDDGRGEPTPVQEFARSGGLRGGAARAAALSPERRAEIARKAAEKRWGQKG